MDREELTAALKAGPIKILMNDGREYNIAAPDEALITDIAAHVLYRSETDGKLKAMILPLVTMSGVEPITN
jgi:hypothetical protein